MQRGRKRKIYETQQSHEGRLKMLNIMSAILLELDVTLGRFIMDRRESFLFLDICCAPGGFSKYILNNAVATGAGVSLNVELGGHIMVLKAPRERYDFREVDVTSAAHDIFLDKSTSGRHPALLLHRPQGCRRPEGKGHCDLIIMDGSYLGGKDHIFKHTRLSDSVNPAFNLWHPDDRSAPHEALLVAQMIVMANNLKEGGDIVIRLNLNASKFRLGVICLLHRMFGRVIGYKPRRAHVVQTSFYLVGQWYRPQVTKDLQLVHRMRCLLHQLRQGQACPACVPFPDLPEGHQDGLSGYWGEVLMEFIKPLRKIQDLCVRAGREGPSGKKLAPCISVYTGTCPRGLGCRSAHFEEELHPLALEAFKVVGSLMSWPRANRGPDTPSIDRPSRGPTEARSFLFTINLVDQDEDDQDDVIVIDDDEDDDDDEVVILGCSGPTVHGTNLSRCSTPQPPSLVDQVPAAPLPQSSWAVGPLWFPIWRPLCLVHPHQIISNDDHDDVIDLTGDHETPITRGLCRQNWQNKCDEPHPYQQAQGTEPTGAPNVGSWDPQDHSNDEAGCVHPIRQAAPLPRRVVRRTLW